MALDYPNTPTTGATYTSAGLTWQYDGAKWTAAVAGGVPISGVTISDTAPPSPSVGQLWWDSSPTDAGGGMLYVWYNDGNSTQWVVADNIAGAYVPIGGATMTGPLTLSGDPTALLGAATKQYIDNKTWGYSALPAEVQQVPVNFPYPGKPPATGYGASTFVGMPMGLTLPANMAGSVAYADTVATASAVFNLYSAPPPGSGATVWTQFGTITFAAGAHQATFSSTATTFTAGMFLAINCPGTADATLSSVVITLLFTRL